jgi:MraZ protein
MDYFERKLDDKNRLTIPAELRGEFEGGQIVLARGFDNTIHLYSRARWDQAVEKELASFGILSEDGARLNRQLRGGKTIAAMDAKQGRVTMEAHLLDYAGIKKDLTATRIATKDGDYWAIAAKA